MTLQKKIMSIARFIKDSDLDALLASGGVVLVDCTAP
jgi:hypothetical protein